MPANPRRRTTATDPTRCIFKKAKTWTRRGADAPQTPQAKWNQSNRHKLRAHAEVRKALRKGELKRGRCEVCGSFRVEAHHEDYSAPLSVTWLCRRHHKLWHAAEQKIENGAVALWIEALLSGAPMSPGNDKDIALAEEARDAHAVQEPVLNRVGEGR